MRVRTGAVILVVGAAIVGAAVVIPGLIAFQPRYGVPDAVRELRVIQEKEAVYRVSDPAHPGKQVFGTLAELGGYGIIDSALATGTKGGFTWIARPGADAGSTWWAVARPTEPGELRDAVLYTNQTGGVWSIKASDRRSMADPDPVTGAPPVGAEPVGR